VHRAKFGFSQHPYEREAATGDQNGVSAKDKISPGCERHLHYETIMVPFNYEFGLTGRMHSSIALVPGKNLLL
jgi:hypothetical protein